MPVNLLDIEALSERLARIEDRLADTEEPGNAAYISLLKQIKSARDAQDTLRKENVELRDDRVTLQGENEVLRGELKRLESRLNTTLVGQHKLDDRDRELLLYASDLIGHMAVDEMTRPTYRLLCRLAQQPVEEDEHARMEDEGGAAAPDRAGWIGTWVAADKHPASPSLKQGDRVRLFQGARSFGGAIVPLGVMVVQMLGLRKRDGHAYTVRVGLKADADAGYWVRPEDIAEVLT